MIDDTPETEATPVGITSEIEQDISAAFEKIRSVLHALENPTWMIEAAKQQIEQAATNVFKHIQQAI